MVSDACAYPRAATHANALTRALAAALPRHPPAPQRTLRSGLASNMSAPLSLSATWVHLLTLDLFVARAVYLDGLARGVPTRHSLVLCMMFGPLGYLLHYATVALVRALRRRREVAPVVGGAEGAR